MKTGQVFLLALFTVLTLAAADDSDRVLISDYTIVDENGDNLFDDHGRSLKKKTSSVSKINLDFIYKNTKITCDLKLAESVYSKKALQRLKLKNVPKSYKGKGCVLTLINSTTFDGLAISKGVAVHFKKQTTGDIAVKKQPTSTLRCESLDPNAASGRRLGQAEPKPHVHHLSRELAVEQWTDCYNGDAQGKDFYIGIAIGTKLKNRLGDNDAIATEIQALVSSANLIYETQLNIELKVGHLYLTSGQSWDNPQCSNSISTQLNSFTSWNKPSTQGMWHLLDDCYGSSGNTAGIAYVGTLCHSRYNTGVSFCTGNDCDDMWRVFAHEAGHNFGAGHSFEEGQGRTGGIMDYGDGKLDGEYQFNTQYRKDEVCAEIQANIGCQSFKTSSNGSPTPEPTPAPSTAPPASPTPPQSTTCSLCSTHSCNNCLYSHRGSNVCFNYSGQRGCQYLESLSSRYNWCGSC